MVSRIAIVSEIKGNNAFKFTLFYSRLFIMVARPRY